MMGLILTVALIYSGVLQAVLAALAAFWRRG